MKRHLFLGLLLSMFSTICQSQTIFGDGSEIYGNQVTCRYAFTPVANRMEIQTEGSFDEFTLLVPFPAKTRNVSARLNGLKVPVTSEQVNQSHYADIKGKGNRNIIIFNFK